MTSTRPRFFSLHKLLFLLLLFFIFTFSVTLLEVEAKEICTVETNITEGTQKETCVDDGTGPGPTVRQEATPPRGESITKNYSAKWEACTGGFSITNCLSDIADFVVGNLVKLINGILSWILSIAMYLLDLVIYITVVKFTQNFAELKLDLNPSGTLGGIGSGTGAAIFGSNGSGLIYYIWGMLRDFVNLLLLILIIYYAVHTMFQGFNAHREKFLYLLIFSIVINFSLFFVKFAIDLSNILSLQAYTLMANPASFEDWKGFRQNAGSIPKATLGDYLLNIPGAGGLHNASTSAAAAKERIAEGIKNSWLYQIGVMFVYIGLIYLTFFIAALLVMRAIAFLFAMLLAALLAADIFFNTFKINNKDFLESITSITSKIKGDFYDALIKGPVLFLFLFLTGVLANAIFGQAIQSEVTAITQSSDEFKILGSAFGASIGILLKFAVFFALTNVMLNKLNVLSFGENSKLGAGTKAISNWAMRQTVGRGAGALGWSGRNTIGRGLGAVSQNWQTRLANRNADITKQINDEKTSTFRRALLRQQQSFNNARLGLAKGLSESRLVKGNYDSREGLAAAAKRATGTDIDFGGKDKDGKYSTGGYEKEDERVLKDRKEKADERNKRVTDNLGDPSDSDLMETVGDLVGQSMKLKDMQKLVGSSESDRKLQTSMQSQYSSGAKVISYEGMQFTRSQYETISKDGFKMVNDTIGEYKKANVEEAKKIAKSKFEKTSVEMKAKGFTRGISDYGFGANVKAYQKEVEDAQTTQDTAARKKTGQERAKAVRKIDAISSTTVALKGDIKEVERLLELPEVKGTSLEGKLKNYKSQLKGLETELEYGDIDKRLKTIEDQSFRDKLFSLKTGMSKDVSSHYESNDTLIKMESLRDEESAKIGPIITERDRQRMKAQAESMEASPAYGTNPQMQIEVEKLKGLYSMGVTTPEQIKEINDAKRNAEILDGKIKGREGVVAKYKKLSDDAEALHQKLGQIFVEPKAEEKKS